jgi:hypothetical protein
MTKVKIASEEKMKTYEVETVDGGKRRITIPASWKVTFGPLIPGVQQDRYGRNRRYPIALRIYESKEQQRAIFTDVASFRDTSIVVEDFAPDYGPAMRVEGEARAA